MEMYLVKWALCLLILFVFYKLLLENTRMHNVKRFFLLGSLLASISIPFITFTNYVELQPIAPETSVEVAGTIFRTADIANQSTNYLYILGGMYLLGVIAFGIRFLRNLRHLYIKIQHNPSVKKDSIFHVLLNVPVVPHSFFNYIFFNKTDYKAGNIPQEVIIHETAHATQKHSWDLIFIEIFRVIFWFNPLLHFVKQSIRLNHEFLADHAVLKQGAETATYQKILLDFSSPHSLRESRVPSLAHSINYSSIKKRFTVMNKHTSRKANLYRALAILPLLALLTYGFSSKRTVVRYSTSTVLQKEQKKATQAQIEEYNLLAKKYNDMPKDAMHIKGKELTRMRYLYDLMTPAQRKGAQPFPELPPPPPMPPKAPQPNTAPAPPPPPKAPKGTPLPPPAPSPLPAPDPAQQLVELQKRGASFFMGPHEITPAKAIEALRKNPKIRVTVDESSNLRPVVQLNNC